MEAWLVWMRSLPKALRPLTSRSFNSVPFPYFEPSLHMSEVFYLFLLLIIVYITIAIYLLLSKNKPTVCQKEARQIFHCRNT